MINENENEVAKNNNYNEGEAEINGDEVKVSDEEDNVEDPLI